MRQRSGLSRLLDGGGRARGRRHIGCACTCTWSHMPQPGGDSATEDQASVLRELTARVDSSLTAAREPHAITASDMRGTHAPTAETRMIFAWLKQIYRRARWTRASKRGPRRPVCRARSPTSTPRRGSFQDAGGRSPDTNLERGPAKDAPCPVDQSLLPVLDTPGQRGHSIQGGPTTERLELGGVQLTTVASHEGGPEVRSIGEDVRFEQDEVAHRRSRLSPLEVDDPQSARLRVP